MEQRFHRGFTAAEKKELWDRALIVATAAPIGMKSRCST